jgi:cell division septal protein FtsQ
LTKKTKNIKQKGSNPLPWVIGVLIFLGLAIAGGIYWKHTNKVERIQFKGYHYVSLKTLQKQVHIPLGINPDSLNLAKIRANVEKIPYVKYARINIEPDGTVNINITERSPIALIKNGPHRAYMAKNGLLLKPKAGEIPNVPILYGFKALAGDTLKSNAFKRVSLFLSDLQKSPAADATISEVVWNEKQGVIALTNNNGVKVIFGKNHFEKHLRNWKAFFSQVVRKEGIARIHSVDLRFKNQIVTHEAKK